MEVGLIGIGNMGSGIAKSLLRAGHHATAYNRTRARLDALADVPAEENLALICQVAGEEHVRIPKPDRPGHLDEAG